ncbi:MAG TPA: hypothetical protein VKD71_02045, partial [Gemmataceae bacterium]|nr:hypothetical protein [Gemmataceae bacterium]
MTKKKLPPRPPRYTPKEWAEYHRDPCTWCIKELRNPAPAGGERHTAVFVVPKERLLYIGTEKIPGDP